jgi:Uma2 family endonuclease
MTASITTSISPAAVPRRKFQVGTTGWTAEDLDDPRFAAEWERGRYEIVEGVLTLMPAAYLDGTLPLSRLRRLVERHLDATNGSGEFAGETDLIAGRKRVARADLLFVTQDDLRKQEAANKSRARPHLRFGTMRVPPTLIIESISLGHEAHDRQTKRQWYASARVPDYWILDAYRQTLECLLLSGAEYRVEQAGRENDEIKPSLFPGLVIRMAELWATTSS